MSGKIQNKLKSERCHKIQSTVNIQTWERLSVTKLIGEITVKIELEYEVGFNKWR